MLTGYINYKDKDYSFALDEDINELKLIPIKDSNYIELIENFANGLPTIDETFLIGTIDRNRHKIIFITESGAFIRQVNNVLYMEIYGYYWFKTGELEQIDKLTFCSPEIDHIFNVNQAFNIEINDFEKFYKKGIVTINTLDFDSTQPTVFKVKEKDVNVSFQINRTISTEIGKPPLALQSCLCFEFEATDDYTFIIDLCRYARNFIRFLCFRKNIYFTSIDIYKPEGEGKHFAIGSINLFEDNHEPEQEAFKRDRFIKYEYIMGNEGKILSDIVSNSLYLRHLPKTFEDGKHIDVSSFIATTAAFEWEFHRNYPNGITKSESTIQAEKAVSEEINKLLSESTGKQKEKYTFLLRLVKSDSMQSKIIQFGKDYSDIINGFGKYLYSLNQVNFDYKEIAKRVSDQRNRFAHGDLDKDFIDDALLDVIFLKYIVYTLQLKSFGLSDENIKKAIKDLFQTHTI